MTDPRLRPLKQIIVKPPPSSARAMMWLAISLTVLAVSQAALVVVRVVVG